MNRNKTIFITLSCCLVCLAVASTLICTTLQNLAAANQINSCNYDYRLKYMMCNGLYHLVDPESAKCTDEVNRCIEMHHQKSILYLRAKNFPAAATEYKLLIDGIKGRVEAGALIQRMHIYAHFLKLAGQPSDALVVWHESEKLQATGSTR